VTENAKTNVDGKIKSLLVDAYTADILVTGFKFQCVRRRCKVWLNTSKQSSYTKSKIHTRQISWLLLKTN